MKRQILLIEDDPENADYVALALTVKGYEVTVVDNAEDGLALLEQTCPDLLLLDVMLPGMTGFELLAKLRDVPGRDALPVIVLTALTQRWDFDRALKLGVTDYLTKPFEPAELLGRIERLLGTSRKEAQ